MIEMPRRQFLRLGFNAMALPIVKEVENSGLGLFLTAPLIKTASVTSYEDELGTGPLSADQALGFLPLITSMYAATKGLPLDPEQAASDFILVHGNVEDPKRPDQSTLATNLIREYESLPLTNPLIERFINESKNGIGYFDFTINKVVLFLDNINDPSRLVVNPIAVTGNYQNRMTCFQATPATLFRSVATHEVDHYAKNVKWQILESAVIESWIRVKQQLHPTAPVTKYQLGRKKNFAIQFMTGFMGDNLVMEDHLRLNEAITELSAESVTIKNGLPYVITGYASPYDLLNLRRILKQANIDEIGLDNISLSSDIVGLLVGLSVAGVGRGGDSLEDNLDFILTRFNNNQKISLPEWGKPNLPIKPFYPEVVEKSFPYSLASIANNGCI